MTLLAHVFPKLPTPTNMLRTMSKKSRFSRTFEKQDAKRAQTVFKFER